MPIIENFFLKIKWSKSVFLRVLSFFFTNFSKKIRFFALEVTYHKR